MTTSTIIQWILGSIYFVVYSSWFILFCVKDFFSQYLFTFYFLNSYLNIKKNYNCNFKAWFFFPFFCKLNCLAARYVSELRAHCLCWIYIYISRYIGDLSEMLLTHWLEIVGIQNDSIQNIQIILQLHKFDCLKINWQLLR